MWSIAVAVLASVIGFVNVVWALLLFSRDSQSWHVRLWSLNGLGHLAILAAGCLLAVGGQYRLFRLLYHQAAQAEAGAQLRSALQQPFDVITIRVFGSDPFGDQSKSCALRLRVITKAGPDFVSQIPQNHMKATRTQTPRFRGYAVPWQSVVDAVGTPEGRALASRIGHVGDWRRIDRVEADIVVTGAKEVLLPDSIKIVPNENQYVSLFDGAKAPQKLSGRDDVQVGAYRDESSPADRLAIELDTSSRVADELGAILAGSLAAGFLLLITGMGLRFLGEDPALAALRQTVDLQEKLVGRDPANAEYRSDLARAYQRLASFWYHTRTRLREAEGAHRQALALLEKLVHEHGSVLTYQHGLAKAHIGLGMVYYGTQRLGLAEAAYYQAIALLEKLVQACPTAGEYVLDLAVTNGLLGDVSRESNKPQVALDLYDRAIRGLEGLVHLEEWHGVAEEYLPAMQAQKAFILARLGLQARAEPAQEPATQDAKTEGVR
jgi:tetratricopeptide (TPR) repeat protein